ncbi:MAG: helix-turn-helix domain-containing protein [Bacteroidales bacterium]|nr:helix-turn-helix domain-containing protein [Bacteroidales bacterium]
MNAKEIHVGEMIKEACKQSNYTQVEIAEKCGISKQTLNGWFKKPDLYVKDLFTISQVLGKDLVALFTQPAETDQRTKVVLQIEIEKEKSDEVLKYIKDKKLYSILTNK